MSDPIQTIVELAGCPQEEAEKTQQELQDVVLAVDRLLAQPTCKGNQQIPPRPETNPHLSEEQRERCLKGRELAEKVNAGRSSAAHSAIQREHSQVVSESQSTQVPAALEVEEHSGS